MIVTELTGSELSRLYYLQEAMRYEFDSTGTIGSRPCEVSLSKILAEQDNHKLSHRVLRLLMNCKKYLKGLEAIKDYSLKVYFLDLMRKDIEAKISQITGVKVRGAKLGYSLPDILTSHMMCCVAAYFRECQNEA